MSRREIARSATKRFIEHAVLPLIGRRRAARIGRFLVDRARFDVPNDMETNGELLVQRAVLAQVSDGVPPVIIDVGAHFGEWSAQLLATASNRGVLVRLHAFEPTAHSYQRLRATLGSNSQHELQLNHEALSSEAGSAMIHKPHEGAGSSSLHPPREARPSASVERVRLCTLDTYCERRSLDHIALLKIDAEGHDLEVLRGASQTLASHRVDVVQFEYNHRWIAARTFLVDAFDLLTPLDYRLGKVTPGGVALYQGWSPQLETFREGNYVALSRRALAWIPSFSWPEL